MSFGAGGKLCTAHPNPKSTSSHPLLPLARQRHGGKKCRFFHDCTKDVRFGRPEQVGSGCPAQWTQPAVAYSCRYDTVSLSLRILCCPPRPGASTLRKTS